jgi:hypothetical protein
LITLVATAGDSSNRQHFAFGTASVAPDAQGLPDARVGGA